MKEFISIAIITMIMLPLRAMDSAQQRKQFNFSSDDKHYAFVMLNHAVEILGKKNKFSLKRGLFSGVSYALDKVTYNETLDPLITKVILKDAHSIKSSIVRNLEYKRFIIRYHALQNNMRPPEILAVEKEQILRSIEQCALKEIKKFLIVKYPALKFPDTIISEISHKKRAHYNTSFFRLNKRLKKSEAKKIIRTIVFTKILLYK